MQGRILDAVLVMVGFSSACAVNAGVRECDITLPCDQGFRCSQGRCVEASTPFGLQGEDPDEPVEDPERDTVPEDAAPDATPGEARLEDAAVADDDGSAWPAMDDGGNEMDALPTGDAGSEGDALEWIDAGTEDAAAPDAGMADAVEDSAVEDTAREEDAPSGCAPVSCEFFGFNCGTIYNGCGNILDCGTCSGLETCGGASEANRCGCTPYSCAALGAECGAADDGCGGTVSCGGCPLGHTCSSGTCISDSFGWNPEA